MPASGTPPSEQAAGSSEHGANQQSESPDPPYTAFSITQQRITITLVSFACLASPLTAILYLPLVPSLAAHFSVSIQAINLTITVYIIFQAFAPLLLSTHSDHFGRRPVYLVSFALYTVASLGIALNRSSYAALITLRAVQSLGASAVLSVTYGTIADLQPSSSRGKVFGIVLAFSNLGTAIGPVIGGAIAYTNGGLWWAFWVMLIFSGSMLLALTLLMPETSRNVVGNGSIPDRSWNQPLLSFMRCKSATSSERIGNTQRQISKRKLAFKSPLQSIFLMRYPDTALILWIVGSFYALWYTVQASIPVVFKATPYNFNQLQTGLSYLPGAAGVIGCMYLTGRVMDYNYRVLANRQSHREMELGQREKTTFNSTPNVEAEHIHDVKNFPIERARSRFCLPLSLASLAFTIGYGWSIHAKLHPAVPLIIQCCMGFLCTWLCNVFNALLVDIFPEAPSTAATAGNLVRCGLSAAAVAVLDPLTQATSRGWFFTIMGIASGGVGLAAITTLNHYGMNWRQRRQIQRDAAAS